MIFGFPTRPSPSRLRGGENPAVLNADRSPPSPSGTSDGIARSGSLSETDVSELLQRVHQGARTGALHFVNEAVRKSLYFDSGKIIASASSVPREQLGHFMVGQGLITEFELAKVMELQEESGLMIGAILVSIGSLTERRLKELLVRQCTEIVYDLLTWTEGSFEYQDRESLPRGLVPGEIDIAPVLLEGLERLEEWMRIRERIPTLRAIPVSVRELARVGDPASARILELVDDRRSVEEIWLESRATEFALYSALVGAMERGDLKLVVPSPAAAPPPPATPALRMVSVADLLDCAAVATDDDDPDLAERYLAAARSLAGGNDRDLERFTRQDREPEAEVETPEQRFRRFVPRLARRPEEFIRIDLTPHQSFLLARIDGVASVGELIEVSPMTEDQVESAITQLVAAGHIVL
jgi:hypothetical protein